jgi:hypothetical protein
VQERGFDVRQIMSRWWSRWSALLLLCMLRDGELLIWSICGRVCLRGGLELRMNVAAILNKGPEHVMAWRGSLRIVFYEILD